MSQAKVDKYKEFKQNRKENLEKEKKTKKRNSMIWKIVIGVLALALAVALGITAYNAINKRIQARPDYDRSELIINDIAGILEEEEETEPATTEDGGETSQETESEGATESAAESIIDGDRKNQRSTSDGESKVIAIVYAGTQILL